MSASDVLRQQNEEYEESLIQDILREEEEMRQQRLKERSIQEEEDALQQAIRASLSEQTELDSETEKPLSPRALREVRIRYFEKKQSKLSNRGIKCKNGINKSLILKSKLRSGKS